MHDLLTALVDQLRGLWRFRWHALIAAWAIAIVGWLVVLSIPNRFEATARVFVDPSTALKPVIQGIAVEQDINAELNLVRQSILAEPQLRTVISQAKLDAGVTSEAERTALVRNLRERINLLVQANTAVRGEMPGPSRLYVLTYQDSIRDRSLRVVEILLNNLVEETLGGKRQGSQKAQEFLATQIRDYEQRLRSAEERLAEFKKRNIGMMPGDQQGDYFTRLQAEIDAVTQAQSDLTTATSRRDALLRQLRGEAPIAAAAGMVSQAANGAPAAGGDTLSRINDTQRNLDDLLLRFTDMHPDVIATRENLRQLKERRESELEALRRGDPNAAAATGASSNPVYQNIQLSLNQAELEIATKRSELATRQRRVGELRRLLDTMPQVEAEYARLTRDYDVTKTQYNQLAERLEKAHVGEEAEQKGSVRFEVIDPPSASFAPVAPNRAMLIALVLVTALAAGVGIAHLLNTLRPVIQSTRALRDFTGLRVLGSVSLMRSNSYLVLRRNQKLQVGVASAALLLLFVLVLIVGQRFAPLGAAGAG